MRVAETKSAVIMAGCFFSFFFFLLRWQNATDTFRLGILLDLWWSTKVFNSSCFQTNPSEWCGNTSDCRKKNTQRLKAQAGSCVPRHLGHDDVHYSSLSVHKSPSSSCFPFPFYSFRNAFALEICFSAASTQSKVCWFYFWTCVWCVSRCCSVKLPRTIIMQPEEVASLNCNGVISEDHQADSLEEHSMRCTSSKVLPKKMFIVVA